MDLRPVRNRGTREISWPRVKDVISAGKLTEFLRWQFSWKLQPSVGTQGPIVQLPLRLFRAAFTVRRVVRACTDTGNRDGEGGGWIPRSIHVTITLNSVCPLVHRRAGTLAKPARARCAPSHLTIDLHAFADHRDRGALINRSGSRVNDATLAQVSFNQPSNDYESFIDRRYLFTIYPRSALGASISSSCGRVFLSITDPGLYSFHYSRSKTSRIMYLLRYEFIHCASNNPSDDRSCLIFVTT